MMFKLLKSANTAHTKISIHAILIGEKNIKNMILNGLSSFIKKLARN